MDRTAHSGHNSDHVNDVSLAAAKAQLSEVVNRVSTQHERVTVTVLAVAARFNVYRPQ